MKPTIELYRPPSKSMNHETLRNLLSNNPKFLVDVRIDLPNKLNVHAQEFQMNRGMELQNSRLISPH